MGNALFLLIFVVVALISGVQALMKKAKEMNAANDPRRVQRQQANKQQVQSEIDAFLQEVTGQAPAPRAQQPRPPAAKVRPPAQQRPQPPQQRAPQRPRQQPQRPQPPQQRPAPRQQAPRRPQPPPRPRTPPPPVERSQASDRLGQGVIDHVEEYIEDHVESHINHDVTDGVRAHLGDNEFDTVEEYTDDSVTAGLMATLRNPAGIQQAILVSEILNRPRVFRDPPS